MKSRLTTVCLGAFLFANPPTLFAAADGQLLLLKESEKRIRFSVNQFGYEVTSSARTGIRATTKTQGDFNLSNRFAFEIDGVIVSGVHTIDGLESESDVTEYKDGEDPVTHTRPGNHKPGKMTVSKNLSNTSDWYRWRKAVLDGKVDRRTASVTFLGNTGRETARVELLECVPVRYEVTTEPLDPKTPRREVLELECATVRVQGLLPPGF
jgi:phage tail-like protein